MERGGQTYYYHFDGLGSVTEITDSTGATVETYSYDVYGNPTIKDASDDVLAESAIGNPYTFTGRQLDNKTGLYYYRARYYSSRLGRFLQTDPIGYFGGMNLYTYCKNNPIIFIDPLGWDMEKKEFELTITTGGSVGYAIVGGGVLDVTITDLQTGENTTYIVPVIGIGVGLPEINITSKPIRFSIEDPNMTSADFEGYGYIGGASVIVGGGFTIGGGYKNSTWTIYPW